MVYCTRCGAKNDDDAEICSKCEVPLQHSRPEKKYRSNTECFGSSDRKRAEDECFGLPQGGALVGIIFGIIIVIIGLAIFTGLSILDYIGPLIIVIVGILIISGALYGMLRRH